MSKLDSLLQVACQLRHGLLRKLETDTSRFRDTVTRAESGFATDSTWSKLTSLVQVVSELHDARVKLKPTRSASSVTQAQNGVTTHSTCVYKQMTRKPIHIVDITTRECFKWQFQWARETLHKTWQTQVHQHKYERTFTETQMIALCFRGCTDYFREDKKKVQRAYHENDITHDYGLRHVRHSVTKTKKSVTVCSKCVSKKMLRKHVNMDNVRTRECFKRQFQWVRETLHQIWRVQKHQDKYGSTSEPSRKPKWPRCVSGLVSTSFSGITNQYKTCIISVA